MFLNEEKKRLKYCTDEEIITVIRATINGKAERFYESHGNWRNIPVSSVHIDYTYRVKATPMSVNWDHISFEWNHIRVDSNGEIYLFNNMPRIHVSVSAWGSGGDHIELNPKLLSSFIRGDLPWNEAICDRPGHE